MSRKPEDRNWDKIFLKGTSENRVWSKMYKEPWDSNMNLISIMWADDPNGASPKKTQCVEEPRKRCFISSVCHQKSANSSSQIHYSLLQQSTSKRPTSKASEGVEQPELTRGWWKCKTVSTNFEQYFVHFSWKKICLLFSSTIILLSSSTLELWTRLHKIIHMCVYGSFVDNRKQPQCLSTYKWV